MPVTLSEPLSGSVSNVYHPLWLVFSSLPQGLASCDVWVPIMPGCFYEQTSDAFITRLGYGAFVLFFTAG